MFRRLGTSPAARLPIQSPLPRRVTDRSAQILRIVSSKHQGQSRKSHLLRSNAPASFSMNQQSLLSSDPGQAAVSWILDNDNGGNKINWHTCECIWDSSNLVDPNAAKDEVSVYGVKGYLTTPAGTSRSFWIRHCYDFADPPTYYLQASRGSEPEGSARLENFRLRPRHTEPLQAAFEERVRELTQKFREQGIEETAKWLFGSAQFRSQVNGLTNGH